MLCIDDDDNDHKEDNILLEKEEVSKLVEFKEDGHINSSSFRDVRERKMNALVNDHEDLITNFSDDDFYDRDFEKEATTIRFVVKASSAISEGNIYIDEEIKSTTTKKNYYEAPEKLKSILGNSTATKRVAFGSF